MNSGYLLRVDMDLVIDIGNTLQKAAVFTENGHMVALFQTRQLTLPFLEELFGQYPIQMSILSSVGEEDAVVCSWLGRHTQMIRFTPQCRIPLTMRYATPETLGTDRIANAVGASELYPFCNVLSLMAGTCLVADFVTAEGEYLGGSISPGMRMRFRALPQFTAHLPQVEPEMIDFLVGDTTKRSILSGVIHGIAHEIEGLIAHYETRYAPLKVVFSGGDAEFLQNFIKKRIFAAQNPILLGLHKILKLNASEN